MTGGKHSPADTIREAVRLLRGIKVMIFQDGSGSVFYPDVDEMRVTWSGNGGDIVGALRSYLETANKKTAAAEAECARLRAFKATLESLVGEAPVAT